VCCPIAVGKGARQSWCKGREGPSAATAWRETGGLGSDGVACARAGAPAAA
jgi:hypothetical protein